VNGFFGTAINLTQLIEARKQEKRWKFINYAPKGKKWCARWAGFFCFAWEEEVTWGYTSDENINLWQGPAV